MSETYRLQNDLIWVAAGQVLSALAMLAMMKVWAVYLEPAELGLMALIVGVASILVGIMLQPLFQAILVGYPGYSLQGDTRTFRAVTGKMVRNRTILIIGTIGIVGFPTVLFLALHWTIPLAVMGLSAVEVVRVFEQRLFAAVRRQRDVAITAAGDILFRLTIVWFFLHTYEPTAYAAIFGNLLGAFLFVVTMRLVFHLEGYPGTRAASEDLQRTITKEITHLAKPLLPSMILANLTEMGNRYFIGATLGLQAAGLFVASYGFVKRPYGMLNNVGEMAMTPVLRAAIINGNSDEIARARHRWIAFITVFSTAGAVLFFLWGEPLVALFLSSKYTSVTDMLFGLAIAIALFNVANAFNWFSITLGASQAVLLNNIVGSSVTVVLTIALCLMIGLAGAVWALIIGYGMQLFASILTFQANKKRYRLAAA